MQNKCARKVARASVKRQPQTGVGEVPERYRIMIPSEDLAMIDEAAASIGRSREQSIQEAIQGWIKAVEDGKTATLKPEAAAHRQEQAGTMIAESTLPRTPAAGLPSAQPCYKGMQEYPPARNMHLAIEPNLGLWAGLEISREDCLHYICRAVRDNEAALREYAVHHWRGVNGKMNLAGEHLALLSVAKGIAAEGELGKGLPGRGISGN